jgi:hypothetical protein
MVNFIHRIVRLKRHPQSNLPDGVLRHALALGFNRAEPRPGGWWRLRRRAEFVRFAPARSEPVYLDLASEPARRSLGARLAVDAAGMAWRLPWRSSLAACPLY